MNEEMRLFMEGDFDDGMLDISVSCSLCNHVYDVEVESIDGLVTQEQCCNACMRQNLITYGIQDGELVSLEVSNPDEDYDKK